MSAALGLTKKYWQHLLKSGQFSFRNLEKLMVVSAKPGSVEAQIKLDDNCSNSYGTAHGGWISSLVDVGGSLAIASHGFPTTGVSTDLSVSFTSAAKPPQVLKMHAECLKMGRTLAYTEVRLSADEKLVAVGRHTKHVVQAWKDLERAKAES